MHIWFEGDFVIILRAPKKGNTYNKKSIFSVKQLNIKSGKFEKLF